MRKQDNFPNRGRIGEQHNQSVDSDAFAGRRWHSIFQRLDVIIVHAMSFVIAGIAALNLLGESPVLINGVIEL
jgi:hypothetical protein